MSRQCEICHGTGFALSEEGGILVSHRCACEKDGRLERLERAARIPGIYAHCILEASEERGGWGIHHPSHKAARDACVEWVEKFPGTAGDPDLMLIGPPGRGKTHLAVAAGRWLMKNKGVRVVFCEQRALLTELQRSFGKTSAQQSPVLDRVLGAELLILDDLGATSRTTSWAQEVLHDVISHRYNERKHVFVTTNVPIGDGTRRTKDNMDAPLTLTDRLGEALVSRLHEMCRIVRIDGPDYRTEIYPKKYGL